MTATEHIVKVSALRKRFGDNEVLKGIDLDVQRGEVIAIIGDFTTVTGMVTGEIVEMCGLPAGYVPVDVVVAFDASAGAAFTISVVAAITGPLSERNQGAPGAAGRAVGHRPRGVATAPR